MLTGELDARRPGCSFSRGALRHGHDGGDPPQSSPSLSTPIFLSQRHGRPQNPQLSECPARSDLHRLADGSDSYSRGKLSPSMRGRRSLCLSNLNPMSRRNRRRRELQNAVATHRDLGTASRQESQREAGTIRACPAGQFGLLIEVAAVTGARISQLARLEIGDLQGDPLLTKPSGEIWRHSDRDLHAYGARGWR
jgi:integrase